MRVYLASVIIWLVAAILLSGSVSHAEIDCSIIEGLWLFDNIKGDIVRDSSGNGNDAKIVGGELVDGKYGKALKLDGVDDYVVISNYFGIGGTEPRTLSLWFRTSEVREHSLVKWGLKTTGAKYYMLANLHGAECYTRIEVEGGYSYGNTNICDGNWHMLTVVLPEGSDSVSDHKIYVDGVLEEQVTTKDQAMDTDVAQEVHIGHPLISADDEYAMGLIDEVAIFSVGLTEDDISSIMTEGLSGQFSVEYTDKLTTAWAVIKVQEG